jgi:hypothetical protein
LNRLARYGGELSSQVHSASLQDGRETTVTFRQDFPNAKVLATSGCSDSIGILNFLDVA